MCGKKAGALLVLKSFRDLYWRFREEAAKMFEDLRIIIGAIQTAIGKN